MMTWARRLATRGQALLFGVLMLAAIGCGQRPFSILDTRVCKTVDGAGNPGPQTNVFSPEDGTVYVWFRYQGAKPGQVIKVKFTYTDESGNQTTEEVETELKPGSSQAAAQLTPLEGNTLAPGTYQAQIMNQSDVGYGPPLTFTVE